MYRLEDLFEKNDMKMETWDLKVAKNIGEIPIKFHQNLSKIQ